MGAEITYFTRAENDFLFLKFAYDNRRGSPHTFFACFI